MFKRSKKQPVLQPRVRPTASVPERPRAFSYNASQQTNPENRAKSRGEKNQPEPKAKETSKNRRLAVLFGMAVLVVLAILTLWVSTNAKVIIIEPNGFNYQLHSLTEYQTAASKVLNSSIFNRFKLTISSNAVASELEKEYPEISHAAITVPFIGMTPNVYIQLARPILVYASGSGSYILNSSGVVISNTSVIPNNELSALPKVTSTSNTTLNVGEQVLTSNNVIFIQTLQAALVKKGIGINKMNLVPMAEELDVYPTNVGYYVKFNLHENNALQQVGTYLATIATLKKQGKAPSQYIDVMVDGRSYYK